MRPPASKKEHKPPKWIKPPKWLIDGEIAIKIGGKYVPIHLKENFDSHTKDVWIFFDAFPNNPVKITLNKERNGFLTTLEKIKNLYIENHQKIKRSVTQKGEPPK